MDQLIKSIYRVDLNLQEMRQLTRNNASIVLYDNLTINDNRDVRGIILHNKIKML